MRIVRQLDEHLWRAFVDQHPSSNFFHTPEMFKVFNRAKGHQPELLAAIDETGQPLALLLIVKITLMNGLLYRWTTRAEGYGSVLCAPGEKGREALKLLLEAYQLEMRGKVLFTQLRNLADLSDLQPTLSECNFSFEEHLNYLIDLDQTEDSLWKGISKSGRQSVRTSLNKGTIIEEVTDRQKLTIAFQLLQNVYDRVHVPLSDSSLFETAFEILAPREMFKIFLARVGDHYIGTCFVLIYKKRILDWYAGSDRNFSSFSSGELLIWHTLLWGKQHGYSTFDFGGAGKPDEYYGPRQFKAKFGGILVNYGRNVCVHAPKRLIFSRFGYQVLRNLHFINKRPKTSNNSMFS